MTDVGWTVPAMVGIGVGWGDRFVGESALTSRIKAARRAVLDDGRTQAVIRTVHGIGYRIVADVEESRGYLSSA